MTLSRKRVPTTQATRQLQSLLVEWTDAIGFGAGTHMRRSNRHGRREELCGTGKNDSAGLQHTGDRRERSETSSETSSETILE